MPTARHPCKMRTLVISLQVDAAAIRRAASHHQKHCLRESVNFIVLNIRPPNNPDMNQVNSAVWGNTSEDGFTMQSLKSLQELIKSAVATARGKLKCHNRSIAKVLVNSGVALKM